MDIYNLCVIPDIMNDAIRHLDQRFKALRPLVSTTRPPKGWIRAIRNALGMTATQLAQRMGVNQGRVSELEKAETTGQVTMLSLERAATALGCRLVYVFVPERPLAQMVEEQTKQIIEQHLSSVMQTMALENQTVKNSDPRCKAMADYLRNPTSKSEIAAYERKAMVELLRSPKRLWEKP